MLCCFQVSCIGQMVCAVVADSKPHAKRGAAAVKITYEDLPDPIFTLEVRRCSQTYSFYEKFLSFPLVFLSFRQDAIEKSSFYEPRRFLEVGDVNGAFEKADRVHEGKKMSAVFPVSRRGL